MNEFFDVENKTKKEEKERRELRRLLATAYDTPPTPSPPASFPSCISVTSSSRSSSSPSCIPCSSFPTFISAAQSSGNDSTNISSTGSSSSAASEDQSQLWPITVLLEETLPSLLPLSSPSPLTPQPLKTVVTPAAAVIVEQLGKENRNELQPEAGPSKAVEKQADKKQQTPPPNHQQSTNNKNYKAASSSTSAETQEDFTLSAMMKMSSHVTADTGTGHPSLLTRMKLHNKLHYTGKHPNIYLKVDSGGGENNQGKYYLFIKPELVERLPRATRSKMLRVAPFGDSDDDNNDDSLLHFLHIAGVSTKFKGVYNYFTKANTTPNGWIRLPNQVQERRYVLNDQIPNALHEKLYERLVADNSSPSSEVAAALVASTTKKKSSSNMSSSWSLFFSQKK